MCVIVKNFVKISEAVLRITAPEILHFTFFKMTAVCHVEFLVIWISEQLVSNRQLICVITHNFVKIGRMVWEISGFFNIYDGRHPPSCIFNFSNFCLPGLGGPMYIIIPNFVKIDQTDIEISHLQVFKIASIRHLRFLKKLNIWTAGKLWRLISGIMQTFIKIGQKFIWSGTAYACWHHYESCFMINAANLLTYL